jgi:hypothetical protein
VAICQIYGGFKKKSLAPLEKTLQKALPKTLCKEIMSKRIYKTNRPKTQNPFLLVFLSRSWAFHGGGRAKTRQNTSKKTDLVPFSYFYPPTYYGVTDFSLFVFCRPFGADV